ncbi:SAC3/GANP/Nin1/mts3/eIF-3 p25 family-domain-containing protein [Cunninghamella echinulata]|nr:SAC3/GANP/Nin1/mts3/eIF-3 p25 family-domain-containing protein [Cunninghamella echinulata]
MEQWPPSLKEYVEDVFRYSPPELLDLAQNELRKLIMEKHTEGTLMTTDWSEMDLPSVCDTSASKIGKKRKRNNKGGSNVNKKKDALSTSVEAPEEIEKRKNRLKRFQESNIFKRKIDTPSASVTPSSVVNNDYKKGKKKDAMDIDSYTVVGTSTKLEKNYLRLTSAPDPSTVRPLHILKQTLELLKSKWKADKNYTYICDQFKSLRQDLTVQRIKNEFTVQVYEIHARIALEKGDLGEYNQCQTQLKSLYELGIKGREMEFTAYRILYFLHTQNWADINSIMAELTIEKKQDHSVQHALDVRSSLAVSNYHRFFRLYTTTPNMGAYLIDQFVERERVQALIILCKSYRPNLSLEFIQNELAFDSLPALLKFLQSLANVVPEPGMIYLDTKIAIVGLLNSLKKYKKIDIKGQL